MSKALKLVPTPERQALAEAVAAGTEAGRIADAARSVVEKARGRLVAAQTAHSRAESLLGEARERAIGGARQEGLSDLRRAVADAADDVEIAREALSRAEAATGDAEYADRKAREATEAAASAVVAANAGRVWAAAEASKRETARLEAVFYEVANHLPISSNPADNLMRQRTSQIYYLDERAFREAMAPWKASYAELLLDADAPLPEIA